MRALAFSLLLVATASPAGATERTRLHVPIERFVLPNGLTVILHEDHRLPTVTLNLWFRVGAKDERAGRTGFAHLFEHLMFMGTKNVPNGSFDTIMEEAGGANNASTTEDRTDYYDSGPSNLLETFLWLEADRLSSLPDTMTQAKVDLQRDVVQNERRQRIENQPYGKVELVLPEKLYPADHPYHHPVIGSHEDLNAATADDVKAFFRQFYVPSNVSLVIAGDFQPAQARALVDKYFAWMPKRKVPPHAAPAPVTLAKPERVTLTDAVQLPRVVLAWLSPGSFQPGDAACDLLAAMLGQGESSRLYQALVYERKLAQSVEVEQRSLRYGSQFVITATAQSGHSAAELEKAIDEELAHLAAGRPVTAGELERARARVETIALHEVETPDRMADAINLFEARFGDPTKIDSLFLGRYDAVTLPELQSWAQKVLQAPRVTIDVEPDPKAEVKP
jgi:predicted Zn-dependent peptidase